jgi:hypothetical protein
MMSNLVRVIAAVLWYLKLPASADTKRARGPARQPASLQGGA